MSREHSIKFSKARFLYPDIGLQMQRDLEEKVRNL